MLIKRTTLSWGLSFISIGVGDTDPILIWRGIKDLCILCDQFDGRKRNLTIALCKIGILEF